MRNLMLLMILSFLFISCRQNNMVDCRDLAQGDDGIWLIDNKPFTGTCETYENGVMQAYSEFKDGQIHGTIRSYFPDGQVEKEYEYSNGIPHGNIKYYFESGGLAEEGMLMNNSKEGIWKTYYTSGQVMDVTNWRSNMRQDSAFSYYQNGNLKSKGTLIDDKEEGRWIMYDSISGDVYGYLNFKNGEPVSAGQP